MTSEPRAQRHASRRFLKALAAGAGLALGLLLHAPTPAHASQMQLAMFDASPRLAENPTETLATLRLLGVGLLRVSLRWQTLAPDAMSPTRPQGFDATDPDAYPDAKVRPYDKIVRAAQADGIAIEFVLTGGAPRWATGRGAPRGGPYLDWRPSASEYGSFVQAMGTRYSGSYRPEGSDTPLPAVRFWELWNEPNFGQDLAPQAIKGSSVSTSPGMYRALVDAGWAALQRTGHQSDTVLIGNFSARGFKSPPTRRFTQGFPGNFSTTKPLQFLRTLYCVDPRYHELRGRAAAAVGCPTTSAGARQFRARHPGLFLAPGFGIHPYPFNLPPNEADSNDPDYVEFSEIPRLIQIVDRVHRIYGSRERPLIYITEFGYITNPPNKESHYGSHFLRPAAAAVYLNWAEYISWRNRRVASTMQYLLYDPAPNASGFATGLIFQDGAQKPTYDAYRMPLFLPRSSARRGQPIEVWGCVRPAHYASVDAGGALQRVRIQFRRRGQKSFRTLKTIPIINPRGYVDAKVRFPASGSVRLAWSYPSGTKISSRTATVTVR
jgi:hypothetical protein